MQTLLLLFNKYLLSTCSVLRPMLSARVTGVNKIDSFPVMELLIPNLDIQTDNHTNN